MDQTKNCSDRGEEAKAGKANPLASDLCNSQSKKQTENQPGRTWGLSRFEWLGLIIWALATLWIWRSPPANPIDWLDWLLDIKGYHVSPLRALYMFLLLMFFLVVRNYKQQALHLFFTGSRVVNGVSVLEFHPESSARKVGMQKGDVIIEYASEKDVTIEKLSAVIAKGVAGADQVRVVFVRNGQEYSQTLPFGPLGISAMNTQVNVLLKSE